MKNFIAGIPLHVDVFFYLDENNKLSKCTYLMVSLCVADVVLQQFHRDHP